MPKYLQYPNRPFLGDRSYTTPKWEQASEIVRIAFGRFRRLQSRNSKVIIIMQPWHCILVLILEYSRQVVKTESPQARHQSLQSGELFIHLEIAILFLTSYPEKFKNSEPPVRGTPGKLSQKFEGLWCKQVVSRCCCSSQGRTWLIRRVFLQWHPWL